MNDYTTLRRDVESKLDADFTLCPIQFENVPLPDPIPEEFIGLFDNQDDSDLIQLGDSAQIVQGTLMIHIMTKLDTGTQRSRKIASKLSALLSNTIVGSVQFGEAELKSYPADKDDVYFQQNLFFSYTFGYGVDNDVC